MVLAAFPFFKKLLPGVPGFVAVDGLDCDDVKEVALDHPIRGLVLTGGNAYENAVTRQAGELGMTDIVRLPVA